MNKNNGTPIYTESAYRNGQMKAKGAMLADVMMEIQAIEGKVMMKKDLYWPDFSITSKSQEFQDGFFSALQYIRVRLEHEHHGASKEAKKLIGRANSHAYSLIQCANVLLELAKEDELGEQS